jgi:hypothetical protein
MKTKQLLSIALLVLLICNSCKKDDDSSADVTQNTLGIYSGTWVVVGTGQTSGTVDVQKASNSTVNLIMTAGGTSLPTIPKVKLSDQGNGIMKLTYSDPSGTLNGTVGNNSISLTLVAGSITETFNGSR